MIEKVARKIADILEEDHNHRIVIKKTYDAGHFKTPVPDFRCRDFSIKDGNFRVYKTGKRKPIVDGASCAPDKIGSLDIASGYVIHDLMYHYLEQIAEKWDWDPDKVRELADACLGNAIEQQGGPLAAVVSRIYYTAVRIFGGLYHRIMKLFAVVAIVGGVMMLGGCGCQAPHVFDIEDEPDYQVVPKDQMVATSEAR